MSRPRPALGVDPLDTLLGESGATGRPRARPVEPSSHRKSAGDVPSSPCAGRRGAQRDRRAVWPADRLTLARLVENGIRRELQDLRDRHNGGLEFPRRAGELVGGRPIEPLKGDRER